MGRAQQEEAYKTARGEQKQNFQNAQNSYTAAQGDIGNYETALADYAAKNPYLAGGEFESTLGQINANVADSEARGAGERIQSQALRTGQNLAGANATAEEIARQAQRDEAGMQAENEQKRIAGETAYDTNVLEGTKFPVQAESNLYGEASNAAQGELNAMTGNAQTPGFWDQFGSSFAKAMGNTLGGGNVSFSHKF